MSPAVPVGLLLTQSDERLVGYARAGHERAFEALVRRYRRQLLSYCRRLLLSEEHAEDALQQALLQAWIALRDGTEVRAVRPWLYRIVHNAAVNALRASGYDHRRLSESLIGAGAPEEDLDRRIVVREALAGLAALPEMQRQALLRTAVEGASHEQAAGELGVSEPAVRGLVYRARASLRAAASALVPPPLLEWALQAGPGGAPALERVGALAGEGGAAGLAGLLMKGGAVAITAGALAGGIVAAHHRDGGTRSRPRDGAALAAAGDRDSPGAARQPAVAARAADFNAVEARARSNTRAPAWALGQGRGRRATGASWSGGNGGGAPAAGRVERGSAPPPRPRRQASPPIQVPAAPSAPAPTGPTTNATASDRSEGHAESRAHGSPWQAAPGASGDREQATGSSDGGGSEREGTAGKTGSDGGAGATSVEGARDSRGGSDDGAQTGVGGRSGSERETAGSRQPREGD